VFTDALLGMTLLDSLLWGVDWQPINDTAVKSIIEMLVHMFKVIPFYLQVRKVKISSLEAYRQAAYIFKENQKVTTIVTILPLI
jgi:hypothetical protein